MITFIFKTKLSMPNFPAKKKEKDTVGVADMSQKFIDSSSIFHDNGNFQVQYLIRN
jgi:hypothetical protein